MKRRAEAQSEIASREFAVCVIGGGATGAGCALDSQLRGFQTVLVNAGDFAGGTSSASTKIVHGGVRYLDQAVKSFSLTQYNVVIRALHERIRMLRNAPHLARTIGFVIPCSRWTDLAYYRTGMKLYDWMAGRDRLFKSRVLSKQATLQKMPKLRASAFRGSILYADGQFDDSRYNIVLVESFVDAGGKALNYARVVAFEKDLNGRLRSAEIEDQLTGMRFRVTARIFVNATGPFSDAVRDLATPGIEPRLRLSKGVHILLPLEVMASSDALLIPKTEDGRVLFAIPWMGRLLVGTTENEVSIDDECVVRAEEVDYLLDHLNPYLEHPVTRAEVVSGFAGVRPLIDASRTKASTNLAREHQVEIDSASGLISIMGGKWTTYRAMAEDTIDAVQEQLGIPAVKSETADHLLAGAKDYTTSFWMELIRQYGISESTALHLAGKFGTGADRVLALLRESPDLAKPLCEGLPIICAEVTYCARNEMAVTVEDVLFRRVGLQQYSWRSAILAAPVVAALLRNELGWSPDEESSAVHQYVRTIGRSMRMAGLDHQTTLDQPEVKD